MSRFSMLLAAVLTATSLVSGVHAINLPNHPTKQSPRIAIIGAGAAGSSASYFANLASTRNNLSLQIDVYEKNDYIGGRSHTIHPLDSSTTKAVEVGGSIFVAANRNLYRASAMFNLSFVQDDPNAPPRLEGFWNGNEFVFIDSDPYSFVETYNYNSYVAESTVVDNTIAQYVNVYNSDYGRNPWTSLSSLSSKLGWDSLFTTTASSYFASQYNDAKFTNEYVEALTEGNYAQRVDQMHALGGIISTATDGAVSVEGGNWQIFDNFIKASNASLFSQQTVNVVISVGTADKPAYEVTSVGPFGLKAVKYDYIILAAPYWSTGIQFLPFITAPPKTAYVDLHVSLFTTPNPAPLASYFKMAANATVPQEVLTTFVEGSTPEFNVFTYVGRVKNNDGTEGDWLIKMFSHDKKTQAGLQKIVGKVNWFKDVEWTGAFPYLKLINQQNPFPPVKLDSGIYYVNSLEPFISTMETETLSARNAVELLLKEHFSSSICPSTLTNQPSAGYSDYVYGFDC